MPAIPRRDDNRHALASDDASDTEDRQAVAHRSWSHHPSVSGSSLTRPGQSASNVKPPNGSASLQQFSSGSKKIAAAPVVKPMSLAASIRSLSRDSKKAAALLAESSHESASTALQRKLEAFSQDFEEPGGGEERVENRWKDGGISPPLVGKEAAKVAADSIIQPGQIGGMAISMTPAVRAWAPCMSMSDCLPPSGCCLIMYRPSYNALTGHII